MYLLGYDIGSSSIKAALLEADTGKVTGIVQSPEAELAILAHQVGWAEQAPEDWWEHLCWATKKLLAKYKVSPDKILSIGIAYQMHGLVVVDENGQALRPSIIWCDSRAVEIGNRAFNEIGHDKCLSCLLNSPGNFTASKLKWIKDNEPHVYSRIHKIMLPGDYIAMRLTGEIMTTPSGLSEGVLWDFLKDDIADVVLDYYGMDKKLIPAVTPTFSLQGKVTAKAAQACGLVSGIPLGYRAGDQPNNAMALNVLRPGEIAATGGTSGVVYGVVDKPVFDPHSSVNSFVHVNHQESGPSIGVLLCINGCGIQYKWMKQQVGANLSYEEMNDMAAAIPVGADGLRVLPFGNGAERMLGNRNLGAQIKQLQFNRHTNSHLFRAALEGIAFSFVYGVQIMQSMGMDISVMRVGNDNLFKSDIFSGTIANLLNCSIEMVRATGALGAAKASGVAIGHFASVEEAMKDQRILKVFGSDNNRDQYQEAYESWQQELKVLLTNNKT